MYVYVSLEFLLQPLLGKLPLLQEVLHVAGGAQQEVPGGLHGEHGPAQRLPADQRFQMFKPASRGFSPWTPTTEPINKRIIMRAFRRQKDALKKNTNGTKVDDGTFGKALN